MWKLTVRVVVGAAALVVGSIALVVAQGARPQSDDVLSQLLTEVRGLRMALEQMATAGARVQLVLGRVQMQEQRIENQFRRLDAVRGSLTGAQSALRSLQAKAKELQQTIADFPNSEMRSQAEGELGAIKEAIARSSEEVQRLTGEEALLAQDVATEQSRWTEFNNRLDELERALNRR